MIPLVPTRKRSLLAFFLFFLSFPPAHRRAGKRGAAVNARWKLRSNADIAARAKAANWPESSSRVISPRVRDCCAHRRGTGREITGFARNARLRSLRSPFRGDIGVRANNNLLFAPRGSLLSPELSWGILRSGRSPDSCDSASDEAAETKPLYRNRERKGEKERKRQRERERERERRQLPNDHDPQARNCVFASAQSYSRPLDRYRS